MSSLNAHESVKYSLVGLQNECEEDPDEEILEDPIQVRTRTMSRSSSIGSANTFAGRLRGWQRLMFLGVLFTFLMVVIWLLSNMDTGTGDDDKVSQGQPFANLDNSPSSLVPDDESVKASDLRTDRDSEQVYKWYQDNCYKSNQLGRSMPDIYKKLEILQDSENEKCKHVWEVFNAVFRIEKIEAPISLPKEFQEEVKGWLDHDEKLFEQVNHQIIYKIVNRATYEETVFNPIRAKRPQSKPAIDPIVYIKNLTDTTKPTCDFCKYKEHTAEDVFGRIDNEYSASCSNTFKLAKFHGLFFPKQHSPLDISLLQVQDIFLRTSNEWFEKAHQNDPTQKFPSVMWDSLPHAGASQVHPHIHGVLGQYQYVGGFESWHQLSLQYFKKLKRSFWSDFVRLHFALGLGYSLDNAMIVLPLNARKDNEYMILAPSLHDDVAQLIYRILQTYQNKLNVYCFSGGGVFPPLGVTSEPGMPVIFRFGSRGTCTAVGSDVSSLELYTTNNINSDLAKTYDGLITSS